MRIVRLFALALGVALAACTTHGAAHPTSPTIADAAAKRSPTPHTVATIGGVTEMALDRTHIYVAAADGVIGRVAREGGELERIADGHRPRRIAVTDGSVWWLGDRGIERADKPGRTASTIETAVVPDATPVDMAGSGNVVWVTALARKADDSMRYQLYRFRCTRRTQG